MIFSFRNLEKMLFHFRVQIYKKKMKYANEMVKKNKNPTF